MKKEAKNIHEKNLRNYRPGIRIADSSKVDELIQWASQSQDPSEAGAKINEIHHRPWFFWRNQSLGGDATQLKQVTSSLSFQAKRLLPSAGINLLCKATFFSESTHTTMRQTKLKQYLTWQNRWHEFSFTSKFWTMSRWEKMIRWANTESDQLKAIAVLNPINERPHPTGSFSLN